MLSLKQVELVWHIPLSGLMPYVSFVCLTVHLFFIITLYKPLSIVLLSIVFGLCIIVGINCHQLHLFYTSFLLVVGAKSIAYNKILAVHFAVGVSLLVISILGAKIGVIKNVIIYSDDRSLKMLTESGVRQSLGFVWPTAVAIHASFVSLCYWLLRRGKMNFLEILAIVYLSYILTRDTNTRQTVITILVLPLFSWVLLYLKRKERTNVTFIFKGLCYSVPFLALLSIWMTLAYESASEFWIVANMISSGRLSLGQDAMIKYGIPPFGQFFEMYGAEVDPYYYNYIDSSYLQSLILWGWMITLVLVLAYIYISRQAYKRHDYPMLLAVLVAGISSVTSQFLFQIMSCPLLLALFANHNYYKNEISCQKKMN